MVTLKALALVVALSAAGDVVLLDFTAPWCQPCRQMEPTVQRLKRAGYPVQQINVDQSAELATRFRVTGVPCFIMLVAGREVDRVEGACSHSRLLQMFETANAAVGQQSQNASEVVRAQSPDPPLPEVASPRRPNTATNSRLTPIPPHQPSNATSPNAANEDVRGRAHRASVRIRVDDSRGQSVGSGTIIDRHGQEALAATCGHIFRDSQGRGPVHVDVFLDGKVTTVQGTLISHDLERDIALVSFVPPADIAAVRIAPPGYQFHTGDSVFSIGCDMGREPSLRESRITAIDRYLGPPNIEAAGAPTEGRSGGGLFSAEGFLIGICNHADPADDEGIYASLPTIHWELDRVGQRQIYHAEENNLASRVAASSEASPRQEPASVDATRGSPIEKVKVNNQTEVICIVRAQSGQQVYVVNQPSSDLLERLMSESRAGLASEAAAVASAPSRGLPPQGPVVRAQSADP